MSPRASFSGATPCNPLDCVCVSVFEVQNAAARSCDAHICKSCLHLHAGYAYYIIMHTRYAYDSMTLESLLIPQHGKYSGTVSVSVVCPYVTFVFLSGVSFSCRIFVEFNVHTRYTCQKEYIYLNVYFFI